MAQTSIEWCDHSINPLRARHRKTGKVGHYCEKIAPGCKHCYSSRMQLRFGTPEFGGGQLLNDYELFLDESKLEEVRRRRKPTRYFWCDMTDIFGDWVKPEWLAAIFATIDETQQHTHLLLTKRPGNILKMWPLESPPGSTLYGHKRRPNVALITSVSDQPTADELIPQLLQCGGLCPVLGVSAEPLIGPVDLGLRNWADLGRDDCRLDWVIAGGESGPGARPCRPEWIRLIVEDCRCAGVACFVKQIGGNVVTRNDMVEDEFNSLDTGWPDPEVQHDIHGFREEYQGADCRIRLRDKKGGDPSEWPADLRVRQFPTREAVKS